MKSETEDIGFGELILIAILFAVKIAVPMSSYIWVIK
jgi:hypothetical protein